MYISVRIVRKLGDTNAAVGRCLPAPSEYAFASISIAASGTSKTSMPASGLMSLPQKIANEGAPGIVVGKRCRRSDICPISRILFSIPTNWLGVNPPASRSAARVSTRSCAVPRHSAGACPEWRVDRRVSARLRSSTWRQPTCFVTQARTGFSMPGLRNYTLRISTRSAYKAACFSSGVLR